MDEYGYFTLQDAPLIADSISQGDNVVFNYSLGNGTAFNISITPHYRVLNLISHGQPYGRIMVGIMFKGYFHFDPAKEQHPNYVGEKLFLDEPDAILVTELLNVVFPLIQRVA